MNTAVRFSAAALRRAAFVCLLGFTVQAMAQSPAPLALPDVDLVEQGIFYAAARQPDGGTIVAGLFASVNGIARRDLVRLRPDGALDPDWNAQIQGYVSTIVADAAGNLYVGGALQGPPPDLRRLTLAKLSADGVFDAAWAPEADAIIECLALDGAGSIYAVGRDLSHAGGLPNAGIAKLSTNGGGAADPNWNPGGRPAGFVRTIAANANAVYVGGQFTEIGGRARLNLAKLSSTGELDSDWRPEPDYGVFALAAISGSVYVGGAFTEIGGNPVDGLVKLSSTGSGDIDANWNPPVGTRSIVWTLAIDGTGWIYASGSLSPEGDFRQTVKATLANGTPDAAWNPPVSGGAVTTIAAGGGNTVVLGGTFDGIGDEQRLSLAALNVNGTLLPAVDLEHSAEVYAVAGQPDGGIIVGGRFHRANGVVRRNLLRIAADGTLDLDWNPMADGYVYALDVDGDGTVFAGGVFRQVGGLSRAYVAKLATSGNGDADAAWNAGLDGPVTALTLDADRRLYVGGQFRHAGTMERQGLARLSPDGTGPADAWNPVVVGDVSTIALGEGALYAAGGFGSIGGVTRTGVAKISTTTGALDVEWNPSITGYVGALAPAEDGSLYIGGNFSIIDGLPFSSFARLRPNGEPDAAWKPFVDSPYSSSYVRALLLDDDGGIYVGGLFDSTNAIGGKSLERYFVNGSGAADPTWNPLPNATVNDLRLATDGTLLVGGSFQAYGNWSRDGVAALPRSDALFANGFDTDP
ncbi:delta-60 repeat domain-containing protein [Tahibacter soli]|uniref:Delta-60 repeat domain-containing protein n=1 Tax=Tahibacter soli TaxID=2983605 RepID=A0A9X3YN62_9GAMM|nr:delta-60 repeat domain-containing protein [Tahibacter soli]MDC8015456.1 delta-60 repeat domain-containing protein [Tahibacter soli]